MAFTEPRLARVQVSRIHQQHQALQNIKPTEADFFKFEVTATLRYVSTDLRVINRSTLFQTIVFINCKSFFRPNENFLQTLLLPRPWSLGYFTHECLDEIKRRIISEVQQLFDFEYPGITILPSNLEYQVFPLSLEIIIDVPSDEDNQEMERAVMEESMQSVRMIPASNKPIQSLKTYVLPQKCCVCMETFLAEGEEDVKISPMPCGHVFHHQCIVQWLQISYMCPLCRHPMSANL